MPIVKYITIWNSIVYSFLINKLSKDKVIDNAAAFIANIDPGPGAYDTCITALKEQYLDKSYIVDKYF